MYMKRMSFVLSLCALPVFAGTYVLDSALSGRDDIDWTVASSYSGTYSRDPAAGDTVEIPANMTAKVTAGSASWTLINTLNRIVPKGQAVFEVNVPGTYEGRAILSVPVTEYLISGAQNTGTLRKTGGGALELASYGKVKDGTILCDYCLDLDVVEGVLHLYQGGTSATEVFKHGVAFVEEGATLDTCKTGYTYLSGLNGKGFVTLDNETQQRIFLYGSDYSSYSGWMTGKIRIDITAGRHDITCPTNVIDTICLSGAGVCGFTRLGANSSVPSSLGTGNFNFSSSSGVIYLGTEEETSGKTFWLGSATFLDAGAYGGLTLTGKMDSSGGDDTHGQLRELTLRGSNTAHACVLSVTFPPKNNGKNVFYVIKKGTGVWRFADQTSRGSLGVIDVEDGTIQYDSIAEKGVASSLGYSTNLFQRAHAVTYDNGTPVDYAFVLGGDGTEGTMEYTGASEARCSTRPMAIRSKGRFISDSARYTLENVYALGEGRKTLTLAGSSDHGNTAMDIRDGEGTLDVVKDGSGTWTLRGTNTFTGSLTAQDGHLAVWNPEKRYTWFRLTVKENGYGCPTYDTTYSVGTNADGTAKAISANQKGYLQVTEVAVYDAAGNNLARGIVQDDDHVTFDESTGYAGLQPGYAGIGRTDTTVSFNGTRAAGNMQALERLFDGAAQVLAGTFGCAYTTGMTLNNESTWVPIVFRLPASVTGTAVAMDIASGRNRSGIGSYNGRNLKSFRFEGSTDGIHWDRLFDDKDDLEIPEFQPKWFSDPTASMSYGVRQGKGYAFDADTGLNVDHHQYAFSAIGASGNGVLEVIGAPYAVSGLVVNAAAAAGRISNVVFAAKGTIDVRNANLSSGVSIDLPGDYSHLAGVANLAQWDLTLDGEACRTKVIGLKDGKLSIYPRGLRIIFR